MGQRPGPYASGSSAGRYQWKVWRSTRRGSAGSPSSSGIHAPAARTSRSARYVPSAVATATPSPSAVHPATASPKRSSAPCARASARCASTQSSGKRSPARCSSSAAIPSGTRSCGKALRASSAPSSSCGMPCSSALARAPATSVPSSGPTIRPPVRTYSVRPLSASSSAQASYARRTSGTYSGCS